MRIKLLMMGFLLAAATAAAQEVPVEMPTAIALVPVVGTLPGVNGVRWQTDVELVNDSGSEAVVALELPTAPEAFAMILALAPGQVQRFSNVAGEAFGLETALSPLLVSTAGRRSVTIRATVYAVTPDGISAPQPIAVQYGPSYYPLRALDGLTFSEKYRTNLGLVNLGEREAEFVLALRRVPGRNLAVSNVRVPATSIVHVSVQSLFPLISKGTDFSVVVETPSPETHVYASVIENATSDARFIQPTIATR